MNAPGRALERVRVVDISTTAAGAWCSRLLADAGADVVLIESRHGGHPLRATGPFDAGGASLPAANLLANKRAVALDPEESRSRRYAIDLARRADIVVASATAEDLERWGMSYAALMKKALIFVNVAGDRPTEGVAAHVAGTVAYAHAVAALRWRDGHQDQGAELHLSEPGLLESVGFASDVSVDLEGTWRRPATAPEGLELPGPAYRMTATPAHLERRAPRAGEHTFNVLRTWSNITDDHLLGLYESGVIGIAEVPEEEAQDA